MTRQRFKTLDWLKDRAKAIPVFVERQGVKVCVAHLYRVYREDKPDLWFLEDFTTDSIKRINSGKA